ncbi:HIT family protein [Candidatus Woesearchaeota archaeon]|nr:HIT family protein [Candidatus Woesearchaeota archaeon]
MDEDCIFCKIAKGDIPSAKVYEDENTLAFLDIGPVNKGHTLVIPKRHSETLLHMDERDACHVMKTVQLVADAVKKATKAEGFNVLMSNFKAAGQVVPHAHIHIIPRFPNDGFKHWEQSNYEEGEMEEVASKITDELS